MSLTPARILIVMGVASSGKSVTGKAIARRLHAPFLDGDAYHPSANKDKMRAGIPLVDDDRWPWLSTLAQALHEAAEGKGVAIGACSALKRSYRDYLVKEAREPILFVFLDGTEELIASQSLNTRPNSTMPKTTNSRMGVMRAASTATAPPSRRRPLGPLPVRRNIRVPFPCLPETWLPGARR